MVEEGKTRYGRKRNEKEEKTLQRGKKTLQGNKGEGELREEGGKY
jgi:hypothetical protein